MDALRLRCLAVVVSLWLLSGCGGPSGDGAAARDLDAIKASGKLVVLTRNAPTTWYIGRDGGATGPEHDMVLAFAGHLGVTAEFEVLDGVPEILAALADGKGDLAAAGLTILDSRRQRFRFGPAYQDVTQQVVCRRDNAQPEEPAELVGLDIAVLADSSYSARLQQLAEAHPQLKWRETADQTTEQLMQAVWEGELDCTAADSNIVDINRRYFPELIAPMNLSRAEELGWAMPRGSKNLQRAIRKWFRAYRDSGRLAALQDRYYGFFQAFDYVDIRTYIRRIDERFPRYRRYFREAAEKYDLPYLTLAAQGYQESHWDADAVSPTGVRGIMMLTRSTARAMGVTRRDDARQSIFGGARYLARMKTRFDDAVTEPDRTWLALAAYNIGRAHLHDAQLLARRQGLNPHRWLDIKQVLPLLAKKRYYKDLKYGYARGTEPVRYVQRIREYRHVLARELD